MTRKSAYVNSYPFYYSLKTDSISFSFILLALYLTEERKYKKSMSVKTWTVVQFEEECSVEAVPSTWIQGNFCHWPTYSQDKLMNAIKKHESMNTCWPRYTIKHFRNATYGKFLYLINACTNLVYIQNSLYDLY